MLTVKHITPDGETIFPSITRTALWREPTAIGEPAKATIFAENAAGGITFDAGTVYVMNENGSTVGKYELNLYSGSGQTMPRAA